MLVLRMEQCVATNRGSVREGHYQCYRSTGMQCLLTAGAEDVEGAQCTNGLEEGAMEGIRRTSTGWMMSSARRIARCINSQTYNLLTQTFHHCASAKWTLHLIPPLYLQAS